MEASKGQKYQIPMRCDRGERDEEKTLVSVVHPAYDHPIPYPQRVKQQDKQFAKFLKVFKKLHINIPLLEALQQIPSCTKFMKDILSRKRKLKHDETIVLTEKCSAILQKKLPSKLKDLGSFTIPCDIGDINFDKVLYDLGASINLMPWSVSKKLGIGEVKPTMVSLQLADKSVNIQEMCWRLC